MKSKPIIKEAIVHAPVAAVWKAITDKKEMKQWYFDIKEFKPEPGFKFRFYGEQAERKYPTSCKVLEVVQGKKISYTWSYDDFPAETIVTFELSDEGDGNTKVKLTHEGLEKIPTKIKEYSRESHNEGWNQIIGTLLKEYVEKTAGNNNLSHPNQDIIDRFFSAYSKRDFTGIRKVMSPDVTWTFPGRHPLAGTKKGIDEVISFFDAVGEIMGRSNPKIEKLIISENEKYLIECIHSRTNSKDGNNLEHEACVLWTFEKGKIIEGKHFFAQPEEVDKYFTLASEKKHQATAY